MEFLGSASPNLLLLLITVPIVGAILFGGVLFVVMASRMRRGAVKPEPPVELSPTNFLTLQPPATTSGVFSQAPLPAAPPVVADSPELDTLNLDLLKTETEVEMMNLSKSSGETRKGLSARLGQSAQAVPAAAPSSSVEDSAPVSSEPVELLRLLRHPQSGQLLVEIGGQRYSKLIEIGDKKIGQYVLALAAHLLAFTNGMVATEAGLKTFQAPKVGEVPLSPIKPAPASSSSTRVSSQSLPPTPPAVPPPPPDVEAAFLASLRAQSPKPAPPQPQRRGLFSRSKADSEAPLLPMLNLAEQINTIAQTRLRYSPLAATTKLEITSDPGGGILININGAVYHGPDDIPQPEVKALIKASIQEWEKS